MMKEDLHKKFFPIKGQRFYIAGHNGLVGSALVRQFAKMGSVGMLVAERRELDLTDGHAVERFLAKQRPDVVIVAAGKVGGIAANSRYPAEFIRENIAIGTNLIHGAWRAGVKRLLYLGCACVYPRACPQPMGPEHLMTGRMEPTSEPYSMAKLAGITMCAAYRLQYGVSYISAIPCNLYGPNDCFDLERAHVVSALLGRFYEAKLRGASSIRLWGTGRAKRELLYVDDLTRAVVKLLEHYDAAEPVNIGSNQVYSIDEVARRVAEAVGFRGSIGWDTSKPDGAAAKTLDSSVMRTLGWSPTVDLKTGLARTHSWFLESRGCPAMRPGRGPGKRLKSNNVT